LIVGVRGVVDHHITKRGNVWVLARAQSQSNTVFPTNKMFK
jgi:hypothetical protein